ncbi:hypothetical protein Tsubulata_030946 [Turnera subulata]|uniref:Jacalin-type lectin domain-containing protein n=1 Tax=Turnera subulata TaxID=218843 RepID=A0A9Q0FUN0_9ROSI|nr:hypothetical protein Tsubulata_030946 [Turnera subulata]
MDSKISPQHQKECRCCQHHGCSYEVYKNSHISVGPWGAQNGVRWDDGVNNSVRQVVIYHGAAIDSIQIEYDKEGRSVWSEKHGGCSSIKTNKFKLDYPDEYLVSISGHYGPMVDYGPVLVRSLVFESNRKKYGPFGIQQGTHFSFPLTGGKVVGFHGRSSWHLDSIGVYLKPHFFNRNPSVSLSASPNYKSNGGGDKLRYDDTKIVPGNKVAPVTPRQGYVNTRSEAVSNGPWGGNGGMIFDDGVYTGVREVHLSRYGGVVSIRVCYDLNGEAIWGSKNGGSGGIRLDKIFFDYPSEILTHITGYYGPTILSGSTIVKSLTFHTNRRKYGPFGEEQGISFSSGSSGGIIVGFHGRKGLFVDSIGVHVVEKTVPKQLSRVRDSFDMSEIRTPEVIPVLVKEIAAWGGERGRPWDDGIFSGVKKIFLTKGEAICCIQIEYDRNGESVWSIKLEYPSEILTSVCGYYGSLTGDEDRKGVIRSLTFYTNKGKYGPFGEETGTFFTSAKSEGKIVGFHGRSGCYLNAIGIHLQQLSSNDPETRQQGPIKMIINKFLN